VGLSLHTNMADRSCPRCQQKFARPWELERHLGRKTPCAAIVTLDILPDAVKNKPYGCLQCGRRFSSRPGLSRHMRVACRAIQPAHIPTTFVPNPKENGILAAEPTFDIQPKNTGILALDNLPPERLRRDVGPEGPPERLQREVAKQSFAPEEAEKNLVDSGLKDILQNQVDAVHSETDWHLHDSIPNLLAELHAQQRSLQAQQRSFQAQLSKLTSSLEQFMLQTPRQNTLIAAQTTLIFPSVVVIPFDRPITDGGCLDIGAIDLSSLFIGPTAPPTLQRWYGSPSLHYSIDTHEFIPYVVESYLHITRKCHQYPNQQNIRLSTARSDHVEIWSTSGLWETRTVSYAIAYTFETISIRLSQEERKNGPLRILHLLTVQNNIALGAIFPEATKSFVAHYKQQIKSGIDRVQ
jgi:hypothetical protein